MKPNRKTAATLHGAIQAFVDAGKYIPPPEGMIFRNDFMKFTWVNLTQTRSLDAWTYGDLMTLFKICEMEEDIKELSNEARGQPKLIINNAGNPTPNPIHTMIQNAIKTQLMMMRAIRVTNDDVTQAKLQAQSTKTAGQLLKKNENSLISTPAIN